MKLKELLTTLNQSLNNDTLGFLININDTSFKALFNWLTTGIPMLVTSKEGHTHIYLDKEKVFYLLHIVYEHLFSEPLPIVKTAIYRSKEGGDGSAN